MKLRVVSCAPLRPCAEFGLRTRIRATAVERNTVCRTKDVGRGVKENGGWGVDTMTKDGQRSHRRTCERLVHDAVGCQVSMSAQISAAAAPHLRLARPGELCQWHLEWHDRGRQREDRRELADFAMSDGRMLGQPCLPRCLEHPLSISTIPSLSRAPCHHRTRYSA